ncbi:MAG: UvrD-helicase domain-containing protein, partial [Elusimicrobiota bacterium]|nr:UvrD-helicase domain-containing protein [Elusimicrobiota bacterium]
MDILDGLNQSQQEAVLYNDGPLIIFAGAGTGKTRVIVHKIAYLISQGVSPYSILGVTFTNKAANEMKNRVNLLVPGGSGASVRLSTFHSFCAYFLRLEASAINLDGNFLIYDFAEQKNIIKECIKELQIDEKKYKAGYLTDRISRAKDDLKSAADFYQEAEKGNNIVNITVAGVYKLYQSKLEKAQVLDFGDLIMKTVEVLRNNPQILEKYQERFKYILIDEYQDTNRAQYILTKTLASKYKNICVVGDPDQSVYSWRGA